MRKKLAVVLQLNEFLQSPSEVRNATSDVCLPAREITHLFHLRRKSFELTQQTSGHPTAVQENKRYNFEELTVTVTEKMFLCLGH